jgi:hypothetical protein
MAFSLDRTVKLSTWLKEQSQVPDGLNYNSTQLARLASDSLNMKCTHRHIEGVVESLGLTIRVKRRKPVVIPLTVEDRVAVLEQKQAAIEKKFAAMRSNLFPEV